MHHFAHRAETSCLAGLGETIEHLAAKERLRDAFAARGLGCEVEKPVLSVAGDRRADLLLTGPRGGRVAIEIQHTAITIEALETRTRAYAAESIAVVWLPLLDGGRLAAARSLEGLSALHVERFAPSAWERWVHAWHEGHIWFLDAREPVLWRGFLRPAQDFVPATTIGAREARRAVGGFWRASRRFAELILEGPFPAADIAWRLAERPERRAGPARFPAGPRAWPRPRHEPADATPRPPCEKRPYRDPRNGETYRRLERLVDGVWRAVEHSPALPGALPSPLSAIRPDRAEARAALGLDERDRAAVQVHDLGRDRQAEAGAARRR